MADSDNVENANINDPTTSGAVAETAVADLDTSATETLDRVRRILDTSRNRTLQAVNSAMVEA